MIMHDEGPLGQTRTSGRCFRQDGRVVKAVRADPQAVDDHDPAAGDTMETSAPNSPARAAAKPAGS